MQYVYILQSVDSADKHYIGITKDLKSRLAKHNAKAVPYTSRHAPWRLNTYIAFTDEERAFEFEKYLKSGSGRSFAKKRL
jgi:predicted GIY-YIG superfamily endonuclease